MEPVNWSDKTLLLAAYKEYLHRDCGAAEGTVQVFVWHVSKFLDEVFPVDRIDFTVLEPCDVFKYIVRLTSRYTANSCRGTATALRNFLRWLIMIGECPPSFLDVTPTVSIKRRSSLSTALSDHEVDILLRSFDRVTPVGLRGYAATLCMVRLGLRVSEVAKIKINDIDWREGLLRIPISKARHPNVLPLPQEVGEAIVNYIQRGRPRTDDNERHIFVRHRRGKDRFSRNDCRDCIRQDLRRAFIRAGMPLPPGGSTRILRHTAATKMIQKGVTLKEIADVLGHRSIDTTVIYARVDLPALREVAMPWPGGGL